MNELTIKGAFALIQEDVLRKYHEGRFRLYVPTIASVALIEDQCRRIYESRPRGSEKAQAMLELAINAIELVVKSYEDECDKAGKMIAADDDDFDLDEPMAPILDISDEMLNAAVAGLDTDGQKEVIEDTQFEAEEDPEPEESESS